MNDAVLVLWGVVALAAIALVKRTGEAAGAALGKAQEATSATVGRVLQPAFEGWNPNDPRTDEALRRELGLPTDDVRITYEDEYRAGDDALEITWDDVQETQADRAARQMQSANPTFGKW